MMHWRRPLVRLDRTLNDVWVSVDRVTTSGDYDVMFLAEG